VPIAGVHLQRQQVIRAALDGLLEALKLVLHPQSKGRPR
jgi:hypothetical protein